MVIKRILPLFLVTCAVLLGCQQTPAPAAPTTTLSSVTATPTTTAPLSPTTPQLCVAQNLLPQEQTQLLILMQTLFAEFMP